MDRQTERLLWIIGILLVLWYVFRNVRFGTGFQVGPVGGSFSIGTAPSGGALAPWLTCSGAGQATTQPNTGDYSQGGY